MKTFRNLGGKLLRLISAALLVVSVWIATGGELRPKAKPATDIQSVPMERIQYLFPGAARIDRLSEPERASGIFDGQGALLGYVVATAPFSDEFIGYGGKVPMLIGLGVDGKVTGLHVLANSETQSFLDGLREDGLFEQWTGLEPDDAAAKSVDAISEATLSSNAVIRGVQKRLALLSSQEAGSVGVSLKDVAGWSLGGLILLLALASFFWPGKFKRARIFLLGSSVLVLGFWLGGFLSLSLFDNWIHNGVAWWVTPVLAGMGLLGILLPIITHKSFYCVYVCPFGAAQELVGMANKKKWVPKGRLGRAMRHGPKVFLGVVVALLALGVTFDLADVEPFSAFLFSSASVNVLVLAVVFLVLSAVVSRPWCRFFCPTGEILEVLRRPEADEGKAKVQDLGRVSKAKVHDLGTESKGKGKSMRTKDVVILVLALLLLAVVARPQVETWIGQEMRTRGALDVLEGSRDVKNFSGEPVARDVVDRLMKAGLAAHSMKGKRPCDIWVTQERARMDALGEALGAEEKEAIRNASAVLVVVGMPAKGAGGELGFWAQDCAGATQALLYSAAAQGVGGMWFGVHPTEELVKKVSAVMELPDFAVPFSVVPVGVPLKEEVSREGVDLNKVHWNLW